MNDMVVCLKVFGLSSSHDDKGNPSWCGVKIKLGTFAQGKEIPYSELIKKVNLTDLLKLVGLDKLGIGDTDAEFITPEEYERDYGGDEDEDD